VHVKRIIIICMATITHKMHVKLFHKVIVSVTRCLFCEATTSFSLLALSPPHHQKILRGIALCELYMGLLPCTNVLALN
jgi:hypothetical protein